MNAISAIFHIYIRNKSRVNIVFSDKDAINDLQILFSNNSTNELVISEGIR